MSKREFITPIGEEGIYILDTASWRAARPVMNKDKCIECGICLTMCPVNAILREGPKKYFISYDYCKGCGICAYECPKKAIDMVKEGGE
ncbi:4Fe-4S binding protein [Desulfovibrio sp. OttesenSCG-928-C06]|nr:4Fe-4S binding protein [Desulfovibrio sp. OttesenSCG-928-C06]